MADRKVHGTGATTDATGALSLYTCTCFRTQSGMLQCKRDVIMTTTILFSILNILPNWQIVIFTKNTNI